MTTEEQKLALLKRLVHAVEYITILMILTLGAYVLVHMEKFEGVKTEINKLK